MHFKRFRISGYKSFAESVDVDILPGLTGVVGPNGCGKSNLVESLRWVMGESSAKSLRSGSMEDVIFGGTSLRAPRELAEVAVVLDNSAGDAPQPYSDKEEIEISRHIQRGAGSKYQVNGEDVRARDVNLFFSDLLGGAHSSALVSQGRIDQIILSKPSEKKRILEEAAGITGLHQRRHEAELKLNRAQTNLDKVGDTIAQTENRLKHLEKQAIQAKRYRALSKEIQRNEAIKLYLRFLNAEGELKRAQNENENVHQTVNQSDSLAAAALAKETSAEEALAAARTAANESEAAFNRLNNLCQLLEREKQQVEEKIASLQRAASEADGDKTHTEQMLQQCQTQLTGYRNEAETLSKNDFSDGAVIAAAEEKLVQAEAALERAEEKMERAAKNNGDWKAQILSLQRQSEEAEQRIQNTGDEEKEIAAQLQQFSSFEEENQEVITLKSEADLAYEEIGIAETARREAEKQKQEQEQKERTALNHLTEIRASSSQHKAELAAMGKLFADIGAHPGKAVIDLIKGSWFRTRNLEKAMAAALGDDLMASLEKEAASYWQENQKKERLGLFFRRKQENRAMALPAGCQPLSKFIRKPPVLRARLEQTGLVDAAKGAALQKKLKIGQRLVSYEGHLWRWDGFCADPRIAQATQNRLAQWKTFSEMEAKAQKAREDEDSAEQVLNEARTALATCSAVVENASAQLDKANAFAESKRNLWQNEAAKISTASAEKAALDEAARRVKDEKAKALAAQTESHHALTQAKQNVQTQEEEESARQISAAARNAVSLTKDELRTLQQEINGHAQKLEQIAQNRLAAEKNLSQLTEQISVLLERQKNNQAELETLMIQPAQLAEKLQNTQAERSTAASAKDEASQANQAADAAYQALRKETRQVQTTLAEARENLASQKAVCEAAAKTLAERAEEIESKFSLQPAALPAWAELENDSPLPAIGETDAALGRLERERTKIGAPNLRADEEREAMLESYQELKQEADDLQKAIHELRGAITTLNDEGRARLEEAYEIVSENFKKLFKVLFGGGTARLTLVSPKEDENQGVDKDIDILDAGLDIVARPPGKSIQSMSLLSGGEKTLTALALLFAAFKARPAPICVLDEVDAPLDDKNVERFCNLVAEISATEKTRFLVVTHHSLTLSRMDRLYGVTMEEEGVSRLVSVDLGKAEEIRDAAQAAE